MKLKLTLDRFEGDFGVCLDQDGKSYDVPRSILCGICENDIFLANFDGDTFSDIEPLPEETAERKAFMRSRLEKLLERPKKENK